MTVTIKTAEDIAGMRVAGRLAAEVLEMIGEHVKPGVTTDELDRICHDYIVNVQQAIPAPLNYGGAPGRMPFPKSICTSLNHVVCHGIPNDKPLKSGDSLNIDVTVIKDGYHGDTSKMFMVGEVPEWAERLASGPTRSLMLTKWLVNRSLDVDRRTLEDNEAWAVELNSRTLDSQEGIASFRERRDPVWRGY